MLSHLQIVETTRSLYMAANYKITPAVIVNDVYVDKVFLIS